MSLTITYTASTIELVYTNPIDKMSIEISKIKKVRQKGDSVFLFFTDGSTTEIVYSNVTSPVYANVGELYAAILASVLIASGISSVDEYNVVDEPDTTIRRLIYDMADGGYDKINCHYKLVATGATETVTMTIWGSNNSSADNSSDDNWIDITQLLTGATSISVNDASVENMFIRSTDLPISRIMIKLVFTGSAGSEDNSVDLYVIRTQ